jgi:hypothetical protein
MVSEFRKSLARALQGARAMRAAALSAWVGPDGRTLKREGNLSKASIVKDPKQLAFWGCQESA